MWVVKLGGSLAYSRDLAPWLRQLAHHGQGRVVIVPGGGPFADLVRKAQRRFNFPDDAAHRMALRSMDQYGLLLAGLEPSFVPLDSRAGIVDALAERRVPVWLPANMLDRVPSIAASWDVTSDSLAAWLAAALGVERLLLVKSVALGTEAVKQEALISRGILDNAFARMRGETLAEVRCVGAAGHRWVPQFLAGKMPIGALVVLGSASA